MSRNEILRIFIMSGFMIGMIGTILGLIIGIAFCHNINEIKAFLELFTNSSIFAEEIYFFSKLLFTERKKQSTICRVWCCENHSTLSRYQLLGE